MHDHDSAWMLGAERLDVLGAKSLVHRAVTLPEKEGGLLDVGIGQPAEPPTWIDDLHVGRPEAELEAGIAAEVLVGEEEDLVRAAPRARRLCPRSRRCGQGAPAAGSVEVERPGRSEEHTSELPSPC